MSKPKPKAAEATKTRVLIIDDQPIVRERLVHLLADQPGLALCGQADDSREAMELIATMHPDLVITGLSLKSSHGLELIKDLQARFPRLRVLVFSMYNESLYAERAIRAGARGFVHKRQPTEELLRAVRQVLDGEIYLSDKVAAAKMRQLFGRSSIVAGSSLEQLSDRELEVLQLIGQGRSTRQIGAALHLDIKTIETYRSRIKIKLKLGNSTELVREAQRCAEHASSGRL